ncbi:MAG: hypothetical protein AAGB22_11280, partial [Bacteroidota bacterium]
YGEGMKTTRTTTTPSPKEATADKSLNPGAGETDRTMAKNRKPQVTYPNLEEYVPDDFFTTQDQPEYGKGNRKESAVDRTVEPGMADHTARREP